MPISSKSLSMFRGTFTFNEEDLWRNILQEHPRYSHIKPETWPIITFEKVVDGCGESVLHDMLPRYVVYDQLTISQLLTIFPRPQIRQECHRRWPFNFYADGTSKIVAILTDSEYHEFAEHIRQLQQSEPSALSVPHDTLVDNSILTDDSHWMAYARRTQQLYPTIPPVKSALQDAVVALMPPPELMPMMPQSASDDHESFPKASIDDATRPYTSNRIEHEQAIQKEQHANGKEATRREPALQALRRAAEIIIGELKWFEEGLKYTDVTKHRGAWIEAERTYGGEDLVMVERTTNKLGRLSAQLSRCVLRLQVGIARQMASSANHAYELGTGQYQGYEQTQWAPDHD